MDRSSTLRTSTILKGKEMTTPMSDHIFIVEQLVKQLKDTEANFPSTSGSENMVKMKKEYEDFLIKKIQEQLVQMQIYTSLA